MSDEVHISSLLIHVRPQHLPDLAARLTGRPGVEIHARAPRGKLALVLETKSELQITAIIDFIERQPGVLAVSMSYHQVERADLLAQESQDGPDAP